MATFLPVRRHIQDDPDNCGPAVAQMITAFLANDLQSQDKFEAAVNNWKTQHPSPGWATPPDGLAQTLTDHLSNVQYKVAGGAMTPDQVVQAVAEGLSLGRPSVLNVNATSHWVVVVGVLSHPGEFRCIDPLPAMSQLTGPGGFVALCNNGFDDPLCDVLKGTPIPPHTATDWCDTIDGDDSNSATWLATTLEFNQVVDVFAAGNPLNVALANTVYPVDVVFPFLNVAVWLPIAFQRIRERLRRLLGIRRLPIATPRPAATHDWGAAARTQLERLRILPPGTPVRTSETWTIRELKKDVQSELRVVAVLDAQIDRGWLVFFSTATGAFILARKASPPILNAFRSSNGRALWWTRSSRGMSPAYPFVVESDGLVRLIDTVKFSEAELTEGL